MARRTYETVLSELEQLERAMRDRAMPLGERALATAQRLDLMEEADSFLAWLERREDPQG